MSDIIDLANTGDRPLGVDLPLGALLTDTIEPIETVEENPAFSMRDARAHGQWMRDQEEAHRQLLEEHDASVFTAIGGSWRFDTGTGVAATALKDMVEYDQDINFNVSEAMTVDEEEFPKHKLWEQEVLKEAKSEAHYEVLKERIRDRREYLLNMEDLGVLPSLGLQMVAEFGNIPNYFTFGLGGLAKAGKLKRFLVAGAVTGSANVAEEAFINSMYRDKTTTDYVVAGALGGGLGWLGTLGSNAKIAKHIDDVQNNFANVHMRNSVDEATDNFYGTAPQSTVGAQQIQDVHRIFYPEFNAEKLTPRMDPDDPTVQSALRAYLDGDIPQATELPHQKIGLASMSQSMHSSPNPMTRYMASELFEFPEGVGRWNKHTAAIEADLDYTKFISTYAPEYLRIKAAWKVLAEQKPEVTHSFDEAATAWIEGSGSVHGSSIQMDQLLDDFNKLYNDINTETHRIMKESGVLEAAGDLDPDFMSRSWDAHRVGDIRQQYGDEVAIETLQESILEGNDFKSLHDKANKEFQERQRIAQEAYDTVVAKAQKELDDTKEALAKVDNELSPEGLRAARDVEKAQGKFDRAKANKPDVTWKAPPVEKTARRMAEALYNRLLNRATMTTADANLLSSANRQLLLDALDDLNLDDADMLHIKHILDTAGKDHAAQPFKHQMGMKLAHQHKSGLRVMDFMSNDLGSAFASKQRMWLGRAAMARHGFESEQVFNQAVSQMKRHGQDRGMSDPEITADAKRLEAGWKMVLGQPIEDMSAPGQTAMRVVRKLMATSSLGKLGIVQAGETGRAMAAVGAENMLQTLPMLRDMVMHLRDGRMDTATLADIEDYVTGKIGAEHYMNHPDFRADDFGHRISPAEQQLDRMSFWLSKYSGWQGIHNIQKKFLMNGLAQRWRRDLLEGRMTVTQMKDLGVPIHHIDRLKEEMQKHSKPIEGTGTYHLHLGEWDPEIRRTFALMLHRKSNNAIQDIVAGETPLWINHGIGKFIGQFRTFSIAALGKQTVHDWRMHREGDPEAALAFQFMLATSSMAVMARIGFDAAAMPENKRKKYLANNMNIKNIVKRTISYHGQLSPVMDGAEFLASSFMPNTWGELTGTSQYRNGRGLASKIPGISYINKAAKGVSGLGKAVLPGETMKESDWNALVGVMPLSSWYGFHALNSRVIKPQLFE